MSCLIGQLPAHAAGFTDILENNYKYKIKTICEPQLSKRGLYPLQSTRETQSQVELMMNIIAYSDGQLDLLSIAEIVEADFFTCLSISEKLLSNQLMEIINEE